MRTVDCRGLSCPEPVLIVKRELKKDEFPMKVLCSDNAPYMNISRLLKTMKFDFEGKEEDGDLIIEVSGPTED